MAHHVKTALRKQAAHKGLSQVMAPQSNNDSMRVTYTNKEDLEMACLEEARRQFTEAACTPMLQQPMIELGDLQTWTNQPSIKYSTAISSALTRVIHTSANSCHIYVNQSTSQ